MVKSIYIHIPFCDKICSYCDFCKELYNSVLVDKYLLALEKEVVKNYKGEIFDTIYIGGGTPSSLSLEQLTKLFKITELFKKSSNVEFTIEANFSNMSYEKLDLFKKYGINRLSLGIESTNEKHLKYLNRDLDKNEVKNIIDYAKKIGINNINLDLIYALKNETIDDVKSDLDFILSLDVTHISTYSLIIEENTVLGIRKEKNISEDLDLDMYKFICNYLKEHNFIHYEISNFAKEGYYSRHNQVYWHNLEYYGFGLGASSYIGNKRCTNTRAIKKYLSGNYLLETEIVDIKRDMEYEIMLNLRLTEGINKAKFSKRFGKNIELCYNYSRLVQDGYLEEDNNYLRIKEEYFYVSNEIIALIIEGEIDG